jgi:putative hydrolase of the HAD superfamily
MAAPSREAGQREKEDDVTLTVGHRSRIRSIVFDLDGTLYVNERVGNEIEQAACSLIARSRGVSREGGCGLLRHAREQLSAMHGPAPSLNRICIEMGIDLREFHDALHREVHPERHILPDPLLRALLASLGERCRLYLYTNNNYFLSRKILTLLGVENLFDKLFPIEFCWRPKPDPEALNLLLADIGGPPESFLFVGDREHIDLLPPADLGIATLLVREVADLRQIHQILDRDL